jgi:hypothetical protein
MNSMRGIYKSVIEKLHTMQEGRLRTVGFQNQKLLLSDGPPTKADGLYWIYTTYSDAELLTATASNKRNSVSFGSLVARHAELTHLCDHKVGAFRVVYNGIGGLGPKGYGGLRERILGEFRGGNGTGSLAIRDSSLNDLGKWRYSYVLWSEIEFPQPHEYASFSESIERLWRIHYGWPILCTK